MNYQEIMNEKDTREALEFLLPRMHTVQCYNLVEMLLKKYDESADQVFLLVETPKNTSQRIVLGAYLDKNTAYKDKDVISTEFKDINSTYCIEAYYILKE